MRLYPSPFARLTTFTVLVLSLFLCVTPATAQNAATIQISPDPLIASSGQQLPITVQISNGGSTVVEDVGIQCFISLEGGITTYESGPFTHVGMTTPTYIEFGADLTNNSYTDNVDLAPGQNEEVKFNFAVTAPTGATGLVECFLLRYQTGAGFFLLTQTSTSVLVRAIPSNKNQCKAGGWQTLVRSDGSGFKNQGQCIQYVNTNQ